MASQRANEMRFSPGHGAKTRRALLARVGSQVGYFLPYHVSSMRRDEFFEAVEELAKEEAIKTAIVFGGASGEGTTEAFRAGLLKNRENPAAFFINSSTRRFRKLGRRLSRGPAATCFQISSSTPERAAAELESIVSRIKEDHKLTCFDSVVVASASLEPEVSFSPGLKTELHRARFVILDDINGALNFQIHRELLKDSHYVQIACNLELRKGYAIFRRDGVIEGGDSDRPVTQRQRGSVVEQLESTVATVRTARAPA